jgi:hypothetical protein
VAVTYTPTRRTVQVSDNIVRTWRVQPTVAVDVAVTYTPTRRTVQVSENVVQKQVNKKDTKMTTTDTSRLS